MKKLLLTVLLGLITLCPVSAMAYLGLNVGGYFPQGENLKGGTGFSYGITAGHYFNENIAAELELGSSQIGIKYATYELYNLSFNVVASKQFSSIKPYFKAGIGYYLGSITVLDTQYGSAIGGQFGVGISMKNGFGIEGKYISAKPKFDGQELDSSGAVITIFWGASF
jgi:hypothetical protein